MADSELATRPPSVMEDPSASSVARVYAVALLDAAGPAGMDAALEELRSFVNELLPAVPDLQRLLLSPSFAPEEQVAVLDRAIAPRSTPLLANFLRVLARHRRFSLLWLILDVATREAEQRAGKKRVQVRSAVPLSAETVQALSAKLAESLSAEPILEAAVDPSILGGLIVRVGDTVYDGSLRTRLKLLNGRLRERCLHEIQRGRDRFCNSAGN